MVTLRLRIIRRKTEKHSPQTHGRLRKISQLIYKILDHDQLPLIIMPPVLIAIAVPEWWHWYQRSPTLTPIFLTLAASSLLFYCFYKFVEHEK
ncbi:MAG: hypothetical protein AABY47_05055 [Pseudomonadota bacterium]